MQKENNFQFAITHLAKYPSNMKEKERYVQINKNSKNLLPKDLC